MLERETQQSITIQGFNDGLMPSVSQIVKVGEIYTEIFSGPPWNEEFKCNLCSQYFGPEFKMGECCKCCKNGIFVKAHPVEETVKSVRELVEKPKY